jgi:hypothetical protein
MPNTKNEPGKSDPPVDPGATPPVDPPAIDPEKFVSKEDFDGIKQQLDQAMLRAQAAPALAPAAPVADPSVEKIADIDKKLGPLYESYDKAVYDGKGTGAIMQQINNLERQKTVAENQAMIKSEVGQVTQFGTDALGQISTEITAGKMTRLQIPEVKQAYDTALATMTPANKANPQVLLGAYNYAVGQNIDRVIEIEQEAAIRKAAEDAASPQDPGASSGGRGGPAGGGDGDVKPEDILSKENLLAIKGVGKTVDEYYHSLDPTCANFAEYYKKNQEHFDEGGE